MALPSISGHITCLLPVRQVHNPPPTGSGSLSSTTSCIGTDFGADMVQRVSTVSFEGIEVRPVDVQVQVAPGMPAFTIVGLPDKAASEARERGRSALTASGLALPSRRITIN